MISSPQSKLVMWPTLSFSLVHVHCPNTKLLREDGRRRGMSLEKYLCQTSETWCSRKWESEDSSPWCLICLFTAGGFGEERLGIDDTASAWIVVFTQKMLNVQRPRFSFREDVSSWCLRVPLRKVMCTIISQYRAHWRSKGVQLYKTPIIGIF